MNIIELAKEAGLEQVVAIDPKNGTKLVKSLPPELLERFAAIVRAEREWVDLTDGEIENCALSHSSVDFGRAVIAAFKEKNK